MNLFVLVLTCSCTSSQDLAPKDNKNSSFFLVHLKCAFCYMSINYLMLLPQVHIDLRDQTKAITIHVSNFDSFALSAMLCIED